jgi:amino acid adenylation domain-containing protein
MDSAETASDLMELSEKKRGMIEYLLGKSKKQTSRQTRARIPRLSATEAPLSFAQQRLWFIEQFEPNTSAYHISAALHLFGPLKVEALAQSLAEIARRHEALRTRFGLRDGEPVQIIEPLAAFELPLLDLTDLDDPETAARRRILQEIQKPFDLSNCPLVRTVLLRLAPQHYVALFTMHHIISDGWSLGVLLRELTALYTARSEGGGAELVPLRVQYADYAVWQRQWMRGEGLEEQLAYWREQLAEAGMLELMGDRPRPAAQSFRGAVEVLELPQDLSGALQHLSRIEGVTLFVTLLAAFNVLLHKYTGQQDLCVGTPIAGRNKAELEPLMGFFVNMLVMRTRFSADLPFRALLAQVKKTAFDAYAHQDLPFERLVEELRPDRRSSHTPLFQVMFALQNVPFDAPRLSSLTVRMVDLDIPTAKFDLALYVSQGEQGLTATLNYSTDLFDAVTIRRMLHHFTTLLTAIAADADAEIFDLPILTRPERALILAQWNDTEAEYPRGKCVQELFEAQVECGPDRAALVYEGRRLTYGELNRRANQLAHFLRRLGVGPETFVGVYVQRSLEMVICLLGIIKAGGAYVPLDPAYPEGRLSFILDATGLSVLLTSKELVDRLSVFACRKVCIAEGWGLIAGHPEQNPALNITPENLIYVNYTSGSTGRPKGVLAHHESVVSYLSFIATAYGVSGNDKVLQVPSLSFDASVRDIFAPLITGAQLVITDGAQAKQPSALLHSLREHSITCLLSIVPTLLRAVVEAAGEAEPFDYPLRLMLAAGEKLPLSNCEKARSAFGGLEIVNQYGATECTMSSTCYRVGSSEENRPAALIGKPIHNTRVYNLDPHLSPVPVGVMGEVYIGGIGLSRGYIDRPELSAERFVPDPFDEEKPGARSYRTGDLARYLPDGHLELAGRVDHQVKVRGFRIELGEIEAVLGEHEAVKDKVVIVREDEPESPRIVAYVVPGGRAIAPADLTGFLRERLPGYMLPATIILLDHLPLNPNGKIDRAALPPPEPAHRPQEVGRAGFRSPTEEILAGIWAEVLGVDRVSARDNFFALGGHSLRAAQVVTRVRKALSSEINLKSLFETDDLAGFARKVESSLQAGHSPLDQPIPIATRDGYLPLSFAQQRLWLLYVLDPESPAYNIPMALSLRGRLGIPALEESLRGIIRRHEILRTRFVSVEGKPVQLVMDSAGFTLPVVDLSCLGEGSQAETRALAGAAAQTPFQLEREPLLRARLVKLCENEYVVLILMHHIISDGWSLGVLLRELTALYAAGSEGRTAELAPLRVQYRDYAVWQRHWFAGEALARQMDYWREQLVGAAGVLELNSDRPRPAVQSFRGAAQSFGVTKPLTERLKALSRREGATLFMTLVAALKLLLYRHTQQEDLSLGTPVANRTRAEFEPLIGVFVNTLVLRTDLSGDPTFRTLLSRLRKVALDAYAHQDVPFEHLVDVLQPRRSLSYTPFFQVMFVLQNAPIDEFTMPGLSASRMEIDRGTAKFDLLFSINEGGDELIATVEYNCDLFDPATIAGLVERYRTLLESAVTKPDQRLAELALLSEAERHQLIVVWNRTQAAYRDDCIHTMFEAQVEQTPDALALVYEDRCLTYAELNRRANRLARHLRRLGLGPEQLAGVCMQRSPQMVVAVLAIMKAGAAYVPFDLAYPDERLAFMIKDSQASVVLTQQFLSATLIALGARAVSLDSDWEEVAVKAGKNLDSGPSAQSLAYVIYTSGSTGKPKGVAIRHHSATTMLSWAREVYTDEDITAVLASTSICFDLSVFELFLPLCFGGKVVLVTDVLRLAEPLPEPVTLINTVPSAAAELLRLNAIPGSARVINLAGEALQNALVQRIYEEAGVERVFNLYGPTEDTTYSSFARIERGSDRPPPIGRPITNTQLYLLGKKLEPVPAGVPGEVYLGGCGLARCYFNRPELTAGKFMPDLFGRRAGERLYATGDLARYLPNGELEFLGRRDAQIKLRGFRIEITEIESVLCEHPQVRDAAVAAVADGSDGKEGAGQKRLVAYVVFAGKASMTPAGLRVFLKKRLPDHMVPAIFVELERLPLTPNGKVDRLALPAPDDGRLAREGVFVAPQTPTEIVLADHWTELLGMARVGINDSFFEVGGDSLLGTQLVSRVQEEFDVLLPLRAIFERQTIAEQATLIEQTVVEQTQDLTEEEAEALLKSEYEPWSSSGERDSL